MVWSRSPDLLFPMWISGCPSTFCWKGFFLLNVFDILPEKQLTINVMVYFQTFVSLICVSWLQLLCSKFQSGMRESFNFVLLFSRLFWLHGVSWILHEFKDQLVNISKRHLGSRLGLHWIWILTLLFNIFAIYKLEISFHIFTYPFNFFQWYIDFFSILFLYILLNLLPFYYFDAIVRYIVFFLILFSDQSI